MFEGVTFFQMIQKGGWTMVVLAGFSILSIGVMLERAWIFRRAEQGAREFLINLKKHLKAADINSAVALCEATNTPLASTIRAGLLRTQDGREAMHEAMEVVARQEMLLLEKNLGILGTTGNVAPFVGLFGTVIGIIRAFHDLSLSAGGGPAVVANGIAEALVATAGGLFVAVPAVIAFNYFTRRLSRMMTELEARASEAVDMAHRSGARA